ncbi:MAG: O-antigen ligase family protein [Elusimicrobiota bacterium]|nr:O-antigen ligase family protein [Elusimicrobiota bacterium]
MDAGLVILFGSLLAQGAYPMPWAVAAVAAVSWWAASRAPLASGAAAWWLPWLGWSVLAAASSSQPWAAVPVVARWGAALLFFAAASASWREGERRRWLTVVWAAGAVLAVAGAWTGWRTGHYAGAHGLIFSGTSRYYGYTAFAVLAAAAAGLGAATHPSADRRLRAAGFAAAALGTVYVAGSRSRGALLGLLAAAALVAVRRLGAAKAALLLAAPLAAALLVPASRDLLLKKDSRYQWGRVDQWRAAAAAAMDAPLHGWGPGNYRLGYLRHPVAAEGPVRYNLVSDHAHSEPLQAAAETGWAGLVLWALGFLLTLTPLLRPGPDPASAGAAAAAAGMAVMLLGDNLLQVPALGFLYFSALVCAGDAAVPWRVVLPRRALLASGFLLTAGPLAPAARETGGAGPVEARVWRAAHALAFYPEDADLRAELALLYESGGGYAGADEQWARAQATAPFNAVYAFRRGLLAQRRGDWEAAQRQHARAAELEPAFRDARLGRAVALWGAGRLAEAREELAAAKTLADPGPQGYAYADIVAARDPGALARVEAMLKRPSPRKP